MPVLPTAHASQSYGRRQLEFFATTGHIADAGRRQKASERRFQDMDGGLHTVRLANPDAPMETGDSIAVLRAQSGPDRQSRPVSVINYRTNSWEPAAPDATRALSRAGITRGVNWWLSMIAMALFAIALVWPALQAAFVELNPSLFGALPAFDLVGFAASQAGVLLTADPAANVPGLEQVVASTGVFGAEDANAVLLGLGLAVLGLFTYATRTWRILWVPVFLAAALASGLVLGGVEGAAGIALIALGGLAALFAAGGLINRVRDASRFRGRVARLSEHMLRNPPQESVVSQPPSSPRRVDEAALAAAAGPAAAAAAVDAAMDDADEAGAEPSSGEIAGSTGEDEAGRTHADPAEDAGEGLDTGADTQPDSSGDPEDEPARTLPAAAEARDATEARDARASAAFGALAAAMDSDTPAAAAAADDDDLPSDEELARARGETSPEPVTTLRTPEAEPASDRDMSLPEPPPLAAPQPGALAAAPQGSEAEAEAGDGDAPEAGGMAQTDDESAIAAVTVAPVAVEDVGEDRDPAPEDDDDPMLSRDESDDRRT